MTNNTKTQKSLTNAAVIIKYRAQTQSLWTRQKQTANQSEAISSWDVRMDNNRCTSLAHRARARRIQLSICKSHGITTLYLHTKPSHNPIEYWQYSYCVICRKCYLERLYTPNFSELTSQWLYWLRIGLSANCLVAIVYVWVFAWYP